MIKAEKKIIGRREKVHFPELDLAEIDAKIDTGAYTSSIHCARVKEFEEGGQKFVSFVLLDPEHPQYENRLFHWPLYRTKIVKNSFGQCEERYVIRTKLALAGDEYDIELSLADRSAMDYPVLLGRKAISRRFLVDVSKKNRSSKYKKKKKG